jgi:hypothetical protein
MRSYVVAVEGHLEAVSTALRNDPSVPAPKQQWPAVLDTRTGRFPEDDDPPRRVYRLIGAPRGSTLYWDQPSVVAAYVLESGFGRPTIARSADAYIDAFLSACRGDDGIFRWGNHAYYDLFDRRVVTFSGGHHELRPFTPAWELLAKRDPSAVEGYLRSVISRHVYDPATGAFNRHDVRSRGHAFLEAGGVLVETAAWLARRTGDAELAETACRIARYSYEHRGNATGLLQNEPDHGRWDSRVCTTEVGLWAGCLLRAADYLNRDELLDMARSAVDAYLRYGWVDEAERYAGQVAVVDGKHVAPADVGYWPRRYADPWNTDQWPIHDYPMALGRACIELYERTREERYKTAIQRLAEIAFRTRPAQTGGWSYAGNFGEVISFLNGAAHALGDDSYRSRALQAADEAVEVLLDGRLFQGYPADHRYEAVDGVGFLLLSLLALSTERRLRYYGLGY